jgi:hypothetical protein
MTGRTSFSVAQTSFLASVKDTYYITFVGVNVWTKCNGRIGETGMVIWIDMCSAIEFVASTFNRQKIENVASIQGAVSTDLWKIHVQRDILIVTRNNGSSSTQ